MNYTITDIAHKSGVSIATVSRILNGKPSVKEANRRKVLEVIERLKFKPNAVAQALAKRRQGNGG